MRLLRTILQWVLFAGFMAWSIGAALGAWSFSPIAFVLVCIVGLYLALWEIDERLDRITARLEAIEAGAEAER